MLQCVDDPWRSFTVCTTDANCLRFRSANAKQNIPVWVTMHIPRAHTHETSYRRQKTNAEWLSGIVFAQTSTHKPMQRFFFLLFYQFVHSLQTSPEQVVISHIEIDGRCVCTTTARRHSNLWLYFVCRIRIDDVLWPMCNRAKILKYQLV